MATTHSRGGQGGHATWLGAGAFASDGAVAGWRACSPLASFKSALAEKARDISWHWQCFSNTLMGPSEKFFHLPLARLLHDGKILLSLFDSYFGQRGAKASIWPPATVKILCTSLLLSILLCPHPRQLKGSSPSDVLHARGNPGCCKLLWALKEFSCNAWARLCYHSTTNTFTTPLLPFKQNVFCDKMPLKKKEEEIVFRNSEPVLLCM